MSITHLRAKNTSQNMTIWREMTSSRYRFIHQPSYTLLRPPDSKSTTARLKLSSHTTACLGHLGIPYHIISYYTFLIFFIYYIYIFSSTMTSTYIYLHIYIKTCSRHHHSFHIIFDNIWLGVQNLQTFKAEERGSTQPRLPNRLLADYQHTGDQSVGDIYLPTNNHWMSSVTTCQVQRW